MPLTQEQLDFLNTDPGINKLQKTIGDYEYLMRSNLESFPYDKIDSEIRRKCIYESILSYVRECIKTERMDAEYIANTMNWDKNALGDTTPREIILCSVFPTVLKKHIGEEKFTVLEEILKKREELQKLEEEIQKLEEKL